MNNFIVILITFHFVISSIVKTSIIEPYRDGGVMDEQDVKMDKITTINNNNNNNNNYNGNNDDFMNYLMGMRHDEYPMIVPRKRTALLVNRLMVALKDALEEDEREKENFIAGKYKLGKAKYYNSDDIRAMDLQRRGHQSTSNGQNKGHIYWRCYFNAVTCF